MTTKQPYFTVIIVAFNSGDYLDECINALEKQIFKDVEIIIDQLKSANTDVF